MAAARPATPGAAALARDTPARRPRGPRRGLLFDVRGAGRRGRLAGGGCARFPARSGWAAAGREEGGGPGKPAQPLGSSCVLKPGGNTRHGTGVYAGVSRGSVASRPRVRAVWVGEGGGSGAAFVPRPAAREGGGRATGGFPRRVTGPGARPGNPSPLPFPFPRATLREKEQEGLGMEFGILRYVHFRSFAPEKMRLGQRDPPLFFFSPLNSLKENQGAYVCSKSDYFMLL